MPSGQVTKDCWSIYKNKIRGILCGKNIKNGAGTKVYFWFGTKINWSQAGRTDLGFRPVLCVLRKPQTVLRTSNSAEVPPGRPQREALRTAITETRGQAVGLVVRPRGSLRPLIRSPYCDFCGLVYKCLAHLPTPVYTPLQTIKLPFCFKTNLTPVQDLLLI